MNTFERERRYLVFKHRDIAEFLSDDEVRLLTTLAKKIELGRARNNRQPLDCIIVESDWVPIYEQTWELVRRLWEEKHENKE